MSVCLTLAALLFANDGRNDIQFRPLKNAGEYEVVARIPKSAEALIKVGNIDSKTGQRLLWLSLVNKKGQAGPAIFGRYTRRKNRLIFTPRFRLSPGELYRATLVHAPNKMRTVDFRVPAIVVGKRAVVISVFPSELKLPANNLKFHVQFSQPMQQGRAIFDRIQLLDEKGKAVHDPWRHVEIWSNDYKRLTLFVHPGRIKTGVNLRVEIGPVLVPGKHYRLLISKNVQNAAGQQLANSFEKKFLAVKPDRARPLPQNWKLTPPKIETRNPMKLSFGEPLDQLLIQKMLTVVDSLGRTVKGNITVGSKQRNWSFHPNVDWKSTGYRLIIDKQLEDLAGNTPTQLFDRDLKQKTNAQPQLSLPFRPLK
jgi:hypothetical protein